MRKTNETKPCARNLSAAGAWFCTRVRISNRGRLPVDEKRKLPKRVTSFFGARGGSRTHTPLRALAPEASESTNSTTRAFGSGVPLGTSDILPLPPGFVNTFFRKMRKIFPGKKTPQNLAVWGVLGRGEVGWINPRNRQASGCPDPRGSAGTGPAHGRWSARRPPRQIRCSEAAGDRAEKGAAGTSRCRGRRPG